MIIGYDGKSAVYDNKKSSNYSRLLLDALSLNHNTNTYFVYSSSLIDNPYLTPIMTRQCVNVKIQKHGFSSFVWRSVNGVLKNLKRHHVQLYHGLCGQLPLSIKKSKAATVVTFENTHFLTQKGAQGSWKRFMARKACRQADAIITLTQCACDALVEQLGADPGRIHVIPPCYAPAFIDNLNPSLTNDAARKHHLPERYILIQGYIDEHSHAAQVLKAIAKTGDDTLHLILAGHGDNSYCNDLKTWAKNHGFAKRLIYIPHVRSAHIPGITTLATACVASAEPGTFPTSAIHAQITGTPLITDTCNSDIVGNGAMLVDLNDIDSLAQAIVRATTDSTLRQQLTEAGTANAARYTPQHMAQAHIDIYSQLLGER